MLQSSGEVRQGPTEESTRTIESSAEERIMEGNKCGHHDAQARDRAKSNTHPFLTRFDPFLFPHAFSKHWRKVSAGIPQATRTTFLPFTNCPRKRVAGIPVVNPQVGTRDPRISKKDKKQSISDKNHAILRKVRKVMKSLGFYPRNQPAGWPQRPASVPALTRRLAPGIPH